MTKEMLTFVKRTQETSKAGKPYTRMSIKTESCGERYISGFGNKDNEGWNAGTVVEIDIKDSTSMDKNGVPYLNFEVPKKQEGFAVANAELKNLINLRVVPMLMEILERQRGTFVEKAPYPKQDSTNDAHDFEEELPPVDSYGDI